MGTKLNRAHSLDSVITWWTNLAFGTLEPAEREVVRGDLAEVGEYGWRALRQVLSLVIRRRVLSLKSGAPWLPIAMLATVTAVFLSLMAMRTADGSAIYLWMWINNSDWTIIQSAGFWQLVLEVAPGILLSYVTLACCSWTCGLLIGWYAQRIRRLSGLLLIAAVVSIALSGLPRSRGGILILHSAREFYGNAAVFLGLFYRRIFPGVLELSLVMLPAWWGVRQSSRIRQFGGFARVLMLMLGTVVVGALLSQNLLWPPHFPPIAPFAVAAPTAYLLLIILRRSTLRRTRQGRIY